MSLQIKIGDLITAIGTDIKALRVFITGTSSGTLTGLTTTDKTSLVNAINEVKAGSSGAPPVASTTVQGIVELATTAEATAGTDAVRAVTPAGLAASVSAGLNSLVGAAPGTLDTLAEIATALVADESTASALATTVAGKLTKASNLSDLTDAAVARTNLSVYSRTELGDPETNLAALYATAKA
jgi:hypothetical protein